MDTNKILLFFSVKYKGDWEKIYEAICKKEDATDEEIEETYLTLKCKFVTIFDDLYPQGLKKHFRPPFVIFYYGDISLLNREEESLAVVGSRNNSEYGEHYTRYICSELGKDKIIVSGLAKGIDAIAHESALSVNGKTVAVLGSGIDNCYPVENKRIYEEIKEKGLVLSEYPGLSEPDREHFPMRNRIISGLAKGVLVTEAQEKSGTLITVACALNQGKEVACLPYPIDAKSACNRLIKEGAILVENPQDVLDAFFMLR